MAAALLRAFRFPAGRWSASLRRRFGSIATFEAPARDAGSPCDRNRRLHCLMSAHHLPASAIGTPMTSTVDGKQFIPWACGLQLRP
jgi:hypothetical protein